jgi:hypothetical protein
MLGERCNVYGGPYQLRQMTEEEEMRVIFYQTTNRAMFIDVGSISSCTLSSSYSLSKEASCKSFEKGRVSFSLPNFVKDSPSVGRNGSGTNSRKIVILLLLQVCVSGFGGTISISGWFPSKNISAEECTTWILLIP